MSSQGRNLRLVALSELRPTEGVDPNRVEIWARQIEQDGELRAPIQAVNPLWVIDGHNRLAVAEHLGLRHVPVQVHDRAAIEVCSWILRVPTLPASVLAETEGCQAEELVELNIRRGAVGLASANGNGEITCKLVPAKTALIDTVAVQWRVVEKLVAAAGDRVLDRVSDTELVNGTCFQRVIGGAEAALIYPRLSMEQVLSLAGLGLQVPPGATRFLIPGRCLFAGPAVSLDFLREDRSIEEKERDFFDALRKAYWRRYSEPIELIELRTAIAARIPVECGR